MTELAASTGSVVQTVTNPAFAHSAGISAKGTHVWVTNYSGNTVSEITIGTVPATTKVIIPSNGATLSGTKALDATASNATSVNFWLLGGSYGYIGHPIGPATSTNIGWIYSWNTTTVPNGSYTLVSEATGPGGSTFSSGVGITVAN